MFRTVKIEWVECFGQCRVVVEFLIDIDSCFLVQYRIADHCRFMKQYLDSTFFSSDPGFSTLFLTLCLLTVLHIAICALCIRDLAVVLISSEHMLSVISQEFTDPGITQQFQP